MLRALVKAFGQLGDPRMQRVVRRGVLISLLVFLLTWGLSWFALGWAGGWLAGSLEAGGFWHGMVELLVSLGGLAAILVASFLLFPAVMGLVVSLFLDEVAAAVEQRHYPNLPVARDQPMTEALGDAASLAAVTIALNLLALPVYLALSFFPPLNLFVFYGLNGYLLGREYFEVVAVRRLPRADVREIRRRYRGWLVSAGVVITFLLTIPLVNLLAPVVATAFMLHLFQSLARREPRLAGVSAEIDARRRAGRDAAG